MFCHLCGAKLITGARFCSKCGSLVPPEVWEEAPAASAASAPAAAPAPEPVLRQASAPEFAAVVAPAAPAPEPKPEPTPASAPKPEPKPEPVPVAEPVPAPKPEPKPEPVPVAEPAPAPVPDPEPVRAVAEELPEEKIYLPLMVTRDQVQQEQTVVLRHDALAAPMQFKLRKTMKDGMRLRLTNAKLNPSSSGAPRLLVVELHVEAPAPAQEPPKTEEVTTVRASVTPAQVAAGEAIRVNHSRLAYPAEVRLDPAMGKITKKRVWGAIFKPNVGSSDTVQVLQAVIEVVDPVVREEKAPVRRSTGAASATVASAAARSAAQPTSKRTNAQPEPSRKAASFVPVEARCAFQLCPERELKTGYHFGGNDDEGNVDIAPSRLTLYKKSKAVGLAFGAIGSAIEGKGKQFAVVRPEDIVSHEKTTKNGRFQDYRVHLKDGRILKLAFIERRMDPILSAMDQFLAQV